jgi:NAD(P)-dependent dehydrogenase (short-subunit alcohol dehydrogenase family)
MPQRNWLITGVSSGLGRALAQAVIAAGDRVTGTVRSAQAAAEIGALHPSWAVARVLDVTEFSAADRIVDEVMREVGPIDILVNNAGYTFAGSVEEATFADIRAQFETNYFGAINLIKAVLPSMRTRRQGHILNVSSMAGFVTPGGIGIYGASKLALESTSEALAHELRPFGINVTVIVPGAFRTQLGHSRRSAPSSIPDYLPQNQARNEFLSAYSDSQRGDPSKAAAVILQVAGAKTPPHRLVIGPDAVDAVLTKLHEIEAETKAWEEISRGTDLDAVRPSTGIPAV